MDDIMIAQLRSSTCAICTQLMYVYHDANRPGLIDDTYIKACRPGDSRGSDQLMLDRSSEDGGN